MDRQDKRKNGEEMGNSVFRRMILGQIAGGLCVDGEENVPCNTPRNSIHSRFGGSSSKVVASTSGSTNTDSVSPGEYVRDPGSILSLQPWIFKRSSSYHSSEEVMLASGSKAFGEGKKLVDGLRDGSGIEVSPRSPALGSGSWSGRGPGALRSKQPRRRFMKPLVPVENSCVPQLYSENFEIEDSTYGPVPSPASARPFIVTDGRRVISKSCYEPLPLPFDTRFEKEGCQNGSEMPESVVGIVPLPGLKKSKKAGKESYNARLGLPGSHRSSKPSKSSDLLQRMLIFSTGVNIGIISSSLSDKKDLDTLKGTLKRMENLVQDLQDELEMKDGLTVKELPNESFGEHNDGDVKAQISDSEPMSKIEAELEAELARLELNITSNHLEEQPFDFNEVDQEFIGNIVQGELKIDMVRRDITDYSRESDHGRDSRESSPDRTHDSNYPVSPRDLSLRLHKVIQHRLEDRIKELEIALAQSQKQVQLQMLATDQVFSERTCSNSGSGSSNQDSPMFVQDTSSLAQPFCLDLSGDALEAYDEAYEEFMRIADSPCTTSTNGKPQVNEDYSIKDPSLIWGLEDDSTNMKKVTWEQILKSGEPDRTQESDGDEEDVPDDEDHDSKMLIQQIVERTKQGSPVLIHAQRMFFSVDE